MTQIYRSKIIVNEKLFEEKNIFKVFDEMLNQIGLSGKNSYEELSKHSISDFYYEDKKTNWTHNFRCVKTKQVEINGNMDFGYLLLSTNGDKLYCEEGYIELENHCIYCSVEENSLKKDGEEKTKPRLVPKLLKVLAKYNYINRNGGFRVSSWPIRLRYDDAEALSKILNDEVELTNPVIYLTSTEYINTNLLASLVSGVATVLVKDDPELYDILPDFLNDKAKERYKDSGRYILFNDRFISYDDPILEEGDTLESATQKCTENIAKDAIECYSKGSFLSSFIDWKGVDYAVANLTSNCLKLGTDKMQKQARQISDLQSALAKEKEKNKSFGQMQVISNPITKTKAAKVMEGGKPLFFSGSEKDLYDGEIKDMIISSLREYREKYVKSETRRADVLDDFLKANPSSGICKKKAEEFESELKDFDNGSSPKSMDKLRKLGFDVKVGNHLKLKWCNDNRYVSTASLTPSDGNGYKVLTKKLVEKCL